MALRFVTAELTPPHKILQNSLLPFGDFDNFVAFGGVSLDLFYLGAKKNPRMCR